MGFFLTRDEVEDLTGYKRPTKQIAQLEKQGIRFHIRGDGYPAVPRDQEGGTVLRAKPRFEFVSAKAKA